MDILPVFSDIDDFCLFFEPLFRQKLLADQPRKRQRASSLALSEVMTIIVLFHASGYRNFKALLHAARDETFAPGLPQVSQLPPLCRTDARRARSTARASA